MSRISLVAAFPSPPDGCAPADAGASISTNSRARRFTIGLLALLERQHERFGPGDVDLVADFHLRERLGVFHARAVRPAAGTAEGNRRHLGIDRRDRRGDRLLMGGG